MQTNKIKAKGKKKYVTTTDSKHDLPVAENIINQDFTAQVPNEKWVTDIIHMDQGRLAVFSCGIGFIL
jgi:putative transposase